MNLHILALKLEEAKVLDENCLVKDARMHFSLHVIKFSSSVSLHSLCRFRDTAGFFYTTAILITPVQQMLEIYAQKLSEKNKYCNFRAVVMKDTLNLRYRQSD